MAVTPELNNHPLDDVEDPHVRNIPGRVGEALRDARWHQRHTTKSYPIKLDIDSLRDTERERVGCVRAGDVPDGEVTGVVFLTTRYTLDGGIPDGDEFVMVSYADSSITRPFTGTFFPCAKGPRGVYLVVDASTQVLPTTFPSDSVLHLMIDVDNMTGDLDITGWLPTGLVDSATVSIRKVDTTPHKVIYDDGVVLYNHVDRQGEVISFQYDEALNKLIVN